MRDDTLSTVQTAEILGGTRQWIYKLIKKGKLDAVRIGRDWRVSKKSIDGFLANRQQAQVKQPVGEGDK